MAVDKIFSVAKYMQDSGAGEIILNSVNRDGMMCGYELNLFGKIARDLTIPTIFLGGAKSIDDFESAIAHGASAVGAGSFFIYRGRHKAVLINYPSEVELSCKLI